MPAARSRYMTARSVAATGCTVMEPMMPAGTCIVPLRSWSACIAGCCLATAAANSLQPDTGGDTKHCPHCPGPRPLTMSALLVCGRGQGRIAVKLLLVYDLPSAVCRDEIVGCMHAGLTQEKHGDVERSQNVAQVLGVGPTATNSSTAASGWAAWH